jgi:tetratricopeptide (TPR) repeat protein
MIPILFAAVLTPHVVAASGICTSGFELAKLVKQGTTTKDIAGSGNVQVKVQVNADGTVSVVGVDKTTNAGDNEAALDIAANSKYKPAMCGSKPQTSFYNFHLKFNGKSATSAAPSGAAGGIRAEMEKRPPDYDAAIAKANAALLASPGDPMVMQLLGVAQYYKNSYQDSAQTFSRAGTVLPQFKQVAAQALAAAAVQISSSNPSDALAYAQQAVQLANSGNSQFSLGVAQNANKMYPAAIATLTGVRSRATDAKTKLAVDRQLLSAYLASNDDAGVSATQGDMKALDPTGNSAALAIATHYIDVGRAQMDAKNFNDAEKSFDLAIKANVPEATVTAAADAAFSELSQAKPDYAKAAGYAEKAIAANPNSAEANYAAGVSYGNMYVSSKKPGDRAKAMSYLNKADQLAKAAGNTGLALQVESQIKNLPQ